MVAEDYKASLKVQFCVKIITEDHFKNTYKLFNLRAPKFSPLNKKHIFQYMSMISYVEV